uniref:NADH dehydrogenase subunit 4L n=1 Tax=Gordionus wolterstorffii TaxID=190562 RepID=A0A514ABY9_9BILA|nr:NADH dehydrogenase subunit 4L [Gordionus wolterstorffii]
MLGVLYLTLICVASCLFLKSNSFLMWLIMVEYLSLTALTINTMYNFWGWTSIMVVIFMMILIITESTLGLSILFLNNNNNNIFNCKI